MITCDTSVLVAAFARWHASHAVATKLVARTNALVDHVAVETYSVLTRMPPPHRVPGQLVRIFLQDHFPEQAPRLPAPGSVDVLEAADRAGVSGGAVYDLLVGLSAARSGALLLSLDRRAATVYDAAGVSYELS